MKNLPIILILSSLFLSSLASAEQAKTYIFINSDIPAQQVSINNLNDILLKAGRLPEPIYIIDIAEKAKAFRGEVTYLHDDSGYYVAEFMPRKIPQVVRIGADGTAQYYDLDFYGLSLLNTLLTDSQDNNNEKKL